MRCAWLRRFIFSLAGVVCTTGLSYGVEFLTPPRPPADNDGLTLDQRVRSSPQPVTIEPQSPMSSVESPVDDDRIAKQEPYLLQPNSSIPFPPQRREREPINLPPPDPVPYIEPPMAVYPEVGPPVIYAPACNSGVMPTCATGIYCDTPVYAVDSGEGCNSCAEDSICGCSCVPNWTIRAELLIWNRAGGTSVPLVTAPIPLASGEIDGGWAVGPRLTAIKHGIFDSCWDLELAYFGIDGFGGTRNVVGATSYLTNPAFVFAAAPVSVTYNSELQNFEVNGRRAYSDWVTWFVGFRALSIDELLTANINAGASTHAVATRNRLYGAQLGIDALLLDCDCWYVNAVGKAGIYGNSAEQVTTTAGLGAALPLITYAGSDTSFVGEIGINANYQLTDRLSVLAGYNLLWVNSLALAPDQLAATNVNTGVGALDVGGNLFYHGFNVGLEYGW
jgi:hypothetical protein